MFVLYAILIAGVFCLIDLIYIKVFQLENYRIKNYLKRICELNFAVGNKTKLVFTKRIKRLVFIDFLINFLIILMFFLVFNKFLTIFLTIFSLLILSPFFEILTFAVIFPVEQAIKLRYIAKAKAKLKNCECKKIAITGSFGKTTTKNILYQLLKEEFDVCATPKSFNTPMGICKTILENLKETDEFLIVEYGARYKGDIDFLAKNFGVDFGIITPIGNCHLETFKTLANIENTKFELCENAKVLVLFNGKSESTKKLYYKCPKEKFLVCEKGGFAYAEDIILKNDFTEFKMIIDKKEIKCKTKLLGQSNVDNIVVASALAYLLKENLFDIKNAIEKLKPVPHRLELIKGNIAYVIDDSYNSNFAGFKQALDVLKNFDRRKIVVSPGMIELGERQYQENYNIGVEVGKIADKFVIMNQENKDALYHGAKDGGVDDENIFFASNREKQKEILRKIIKKGDIILFENDFPDNVK